MKQEERLVYLIDRLKKDSDQFHDLKTGLDEEENRIVLRSLLNVRMPLPVEKETLRIQDEYLKQRNKERGIVYLKDIPSIKELGSDHKYGDLISIYKGDITKLCVDAIVNAANNQMLGCFVPMHNCIDNCIHTYAGMQLRAECNRKMNEFKKIYGPSYSQPTGVPLLTDGYNLPARKIIHVVGPIVYDKLSEVLIDDLRNCYRNCLEMCKENGLKSIAFCCISTGVFNFPQKEACDNAIDTVIKWLEDNNGVMDRVIFNVFSDKDEYLYKEKLFGERVKTSKIMIN